MAEPLEPLSPANADAAPVYDYVRAGAARPRSAYRALRQFGRYSGKAFGISVTYTNAKMAAFKQSRYYGYAKAAGMVHAANTIRRFNPLTPYARFLKSLTPKTSAYVLAYDNAIGLRPLYILYMAYSTYKRMPYFEDMGTTKAFALSLAIATAEIKIIASAAQIVRIPMRTFHAACLLPKVLTVNPDEIDRNTRSGRIFAWTVRKSHNLISPPRISGALSYRNRLSIAATSGYREARRSFRASMKHASP